MDKITLEKLKQIIKDVEGRKKLEPKTDRELLEDILRRVEELEKESTPHPWNVPMINPDIIPQPYRPWNDGIPYWRTSTWC